MIRDKLQQLFCDLCQAFGGCLEPFAPQLEWTGTIDLHEASSIVLDKMDELGATHAPLFLPDMAIKVYRVADVKNFLALDETNKITYIPEIKNCDDFAAQLFGLFAGLVWTNAHALNWFIDTDKKFWFIEPQTDKMASSLEGWQGSSFSMFVGR